MMIEYYSDDLIGARIICKIIESDQCGTCGDYNEDYTVFIQLGSYILRHDYYSGCRDLTDYGLNQVTKEDMYETIAQAEAMGKCSVDITPGGYFDSNGRSISNDF